MVEIEWTKLWQSTDNNLDERKAIPQELFLSVHFILAGAR
jgi:hypothetical protein